MKRRDFLVRTATAVSASLLPGCFGFDSYRFVSSALAAGGDDEHDPEGATVAFERQHIAALATQAREHLAAIDAALKKIDSGIYEICDICGGQIGEERLAVRPASLICVRCAGRRR